MSTERKFNALALSSVRTELKEKGSRFISTAANAVSVESVANFVGSIKAEFHDATHNCYAYFLASGEFRAVDDGEPSGSAGKPILAAIEGAGLRNSAIVVTRYFGGTKLGVGGLIRAYGGAARQCIQKAGIVECFPTVTISIVFSYPFLGEIESVLSSYNAEKISSEFGEKISFLLTVKEEYEEKLRQKLTDSTGGRITIVPGDALEHDH